MTRWSSWPVILDRDMNNQLDRLARSYASTLRKYLTHQQEAVREQAYELGRRAIAKEFGVLDMAQVHQQALRTLLRVPDGADSRRGVMKAAESFLLESLSPFEAAHRGFREVNLNLQQRNRELEAEIHERKRVEVALRRSEKHFQQLFTEAQAMQENLRSLSNKILRTQEEERKHISRELHDEVGQALTAISVTLATLRNHAVGNSTASAQKIAEARRLLQETMETVHRFARDLRPALLDELGLLPALRSYLKGFAVRTGLRAHFRGNPVAEKLGPDQKIVLFRVAQEGLTNVSKHARASQVAVAVRKFKDSVCLEVVDNGRSFKADSTDSSAKPEGRLGLLGMQERVRLVNGQLTVRPQPGKGTTVRVVVPFSASVGPMLLTRPAGLSQKKNQLVRRWTRRCI